MGRVSALGDLVHFGKFGPGPCEADFEAFGFSEPAVGLGFGDALDEVVADLCQAGSGCGIGPQQRAAQAAVLVDAGRVVGAAAVTDGNLAVFEVADELGPFRIGGGAVFLAGT